SGVSAGLIAAPRGEATARADEGTPVGRGRLVASSPHLLGVCDRLLVFLRVCDLEWLRRFREGGQCTPFIGSRLSARAVGQDAVLLPRKDPGLHVPEPPESPQGLNHPVH